MKTSTVLDHKDAMIIIEAIRQKAEDEGKGLAVSVVDAHGELIAFLRTDGCPLPSILISQNKAYTAAREGSETADLGARSIKENFPMTNFGELKYVSWGGGVPIAYQSIVIGAVGVSGMPSEVDIAFAKHGIAALDLE